MEYTNQQLPEGINTSQEHHLKDFFVLTFGVIGIVVLVVTFLIFVVDNFADKIPFEVEKKLPVSSFVDEKNTDELPPYAKLVSEKVIRSFDLPESMKITVHYINNDTVNAFATLGGHIFLYRGLLDKLQHEDELSMLIGHEVSHIKNRHPILSLSHGLVVGTVMVLVNSSTGTSVISDFLGQTSMMTLMQFSREFEYDSDKDAIQSLIKIYGHAQGAVNLFNIFKAEQGGDQSMEFFSTHPLNNNRIEQAKNIMGVDTSSSSTPFPQSFKTWLTSQQEIEKAKNKKMVIKEKAVKK